MPAIHENKANIIEWYFDITKASCTQGQGHLYAYDLYRETLELKYLYNFWSSFHSLRETPF